ncbi:hypothetical protein L484_010155 [Morus notabilis]|uniref:Uncharacterized protein n=2 Tax=Morus notabilis TaxID=981085 RepID=W9RHI9_9ROSA|nr:hypothetical protein L484_010155 [Morus notabilis]
MASFSLSGSSVRFPPPSSPLSSSQAIPRFGRPNRNVTKISSQRLSPTSLGLRFSSLIFPRKSNLHEHENMIGLTTHLHQRTCLPVSLTSRPLSRPLKETHLYFPYGFLKSYAPRRPTRVLTLASNDNNNNELRKDPNERGENGEKREGLGANGRDGLGKENGRSIFNSIRWGELLNPDPDNILAVGLTGLLTWASVQVLWQLLFISLAILLAAIKYSFIAALLIFILITLL